MALPAPDVVKALRAIHAFHSRPDRVPVVAAVLCCRLAPTVLARAQQHEDTGAIAGAVATPRDDRQTFGYYQHLFNTRGPYAETRASSRKRGPLLWCHMSPSCPVFDVLARRVLQ